MLLRRPVLEAIADGSVRLVFRRWRRPSVRTGGTLRTAAGVLAIDDVRRVDEASITDEDAVAAGFSSPAEVVADLAGRLDGDVYRVAVRLVGADPRIELRQRDQLDEEEAADLRRCLSRFDARSPDGPWTAETMAAIAARPGERAASLAAMVGLDTPRFKARVRRLKELGLTESLPVGYRVSPRAQALLARSTDPAPQAEDR